MALPSIATPEFQTIIPSIGEKISYRPFLVKEEKLLLMAMEGNDQQEIANTILKILKSCIMSEVDVDRLSTFDVEYLFLQLRGKSVGEVIELSVAHPEGECKHRNQISISVDDIELSNSDNETKIMLTDDVGVKMKYPTMTETMNVSQFTLSDTETLFKLITLSVDFVFDKENVYSDFNEQEIEDWINTLNQSQFAKIVQFFEGMPKLRHEVSYKCDKCGEEETIVLEGLQSFFT
ncbi:MAG: hypothetical protein VW270_09595 [Candidatus Poseidoniales archaeon]